MNERSIPMNRTILLPLACHRFPLPWFCRLFSFALLLALSIPASRTAPAAEAAFSADGDSVYLVPTREPAGMIEAVRLIGKVRETLRLPDQVSGDVVAVDRGPDGSILLATETALYRWTEAENSARELCSAPEQAAFRDVAYDPAADRILLNVRLHDPEEGYSGKLVVLLPGETELEEPWIRRVSDVFGMTFDSGGFLFFGERGDLWHGCFVPWDRPAGSLVGYRCAPVALLETDIGTSSSIGVEAVAVTKQSVVLHVERMGGAGWGEIVRIEKPPVLETSDDGVELPLGFEEHLRINRRSLESAEILASNGNDSFLCASPDETTVFFRGSREGTEAEFHLVRDGKPPQPLKLTGED